MFKGFKYKRNEFSLLRIIKPKKRRSQVKGQNPSTAANRLQLILLNQNISQKVIKLPAVAGGGEGKL